MMRIVTSSLVFAVLLAASSISFAQNMWRCSGNVYTNDPVEAKKSNCTPIAGGSLTIVPRPEPSSLPDPYPPARTRQNVQEEAVNFENVQKLEQLKQELAALEEEYNNGEPIRMGPEFKNYQKYLDRIERLRNEIAEKKAQISTLSRNTGTRTLPQNSRRQLPNSYDDDPPV